ncbi:DUF4834 family protein [Flavobacteriaceae bacterium F89]|uniref:DUF4834 family protein n=1 Tax=Cerina litoralis TaxID=2874477 RepID=A0AAE3EW55_9FLAO|nr:DUF4834 family protein [Cerina litoralis]MCG2461373.1 DUF4834 family protein [Cerina litoralis]
MGFLRTILIIVLVYYLLKILGRLFAPQLFRYAAKKTEKHFRERFGGFTDFDTANSDREGDVIIKEKQSKKPSSDSKEKVGEYIDFEEIE